MRQTKSCHQRHIALSSSPHDTDRVPPTVAGQINIRPVYLMLDSPIVFDLKFELSPGPRQPSQPPCVRCSSGPTLAHACVRQSRRGNSKQRAGQKGGEKERPPRASKLNVDLTHSNLKHRKDGAGALACLMLLAPEVKRWLDEVGKGVAVPMAHLSHGRVWTPLKHRRTPHENWRAYFENTRLLECCWGLKRSRIVAASTEDDQRPSALDCHGCWGNGNAAVR